MKKQYLTIFMLLITMLFLQSCRVTNLFSETRSFRFDYNVSIEKMPENAEDFEVFIPIPQSNIQQTISDLTVSSNYVVSYLTESKFNNQFIHIKAKKSQIKKDFFLKLSCKIIRYKVNGKGRYLDDANKAQYLKANKFIPLDGKIKKDALKVSNSIVRDIDKAKAIYDYLTKTMLYDKTGKGWGKGDAVYACDIRRGNCTDFHSLFIGMARSINIPARFIMGFPIGKAKKGKVKGYHCWAEFYIKDKGWVPVDISEATKHPEQKEFLFGGLDVNRVQYSSGRDILVEKDKMLNYFIFPEIFINSKKTYNYTKSFTYSEE